jgi:hypothetical protein
MGQAPSFCNSSATKIEQTGAKNKGERGSGTSQVRYEARHQAYGGIIVKDALIHVRRQSMEWRRRLQAGLGNPMPRGLEKEIGERRLKLYRSIGVGDKPNREKIAGRIRLIGRDTVQTTPDSGLKKRRVTDERARGVSDSGRWSSRRGKKGEGKGEERSWAAAGRAWAAAEKGFVAWAGLLVARERGGRVWGSSGRIERGGGVAFGPQSRGGSFSFFLCLFFSFISKPFAN